MTEKKIDQEIKKKYGISDEDLINIFMCWKNKFTIELDILDKNIRKDLINELIEEYKRNPIFNIIRWLESKK